MNASPVKCSENIVPVAFTDALSERYLAYALSTITARSLPDVRDGLKPVHRRLLYAMLQLKLSPTEGFKKCARVVGDVIGKYHPHGDASVYDAMVRLAQFFSIRYKVVDGQGNFGSIDGDAAAAMRYTEARLTAYALALAEDIAMDTVDFIPNYDGSEREPAVMPAAVPNLLANGADGIAVGMATAIPPHNVGELCRALAYVLLNPEATVAELAKFVPGPDFPTGGVLVESEEAIVRAYETGKGAFRLRAKWEKEDLGRGSYQIVVTEIPYQVQKSRLIERIADLIKNKKLAALADVRDESAEDIRLILEPKNRQVPAEALMESLFRLTELENRLTFNMNVLDKNGAPSVMSLKQAMAAFLDHRREVLVRKSNHRLLAVADRMEILEGFLVAYLNLDEIIRIIREEDEPKLVMMTTWPLTDRQAEAILNMRLRSLRKLEELEIRSEHAALAKEKEELEALLASETKQTDALLAQIHDVEKKFGESDAEEGARRTVIDGAPPPAASAGDVVDLTVEKEPLTVFCSQKGWIRAYKGHHYPPDQAKYKDGDAEKFVLNCHTTDKLLAFTDDGKFYTLPASALSGGKSDGDPLHVLFDMPQGAKTIALLPYMAGSHYLLAATDGKGFRLPAEEAVGRTKLGKHIFSPGDGAAPLFCLPIHTDRLAFVGDNRKILILQPEDVPILKKGMGVKLQKYSHGGLFDVMPFNAADGLSWKTGTRTRTVTDIAPWEGKRGSSGKTAPLGFPRKQGWLL
ncbi:MAG: DNA topoisomerase IV subunit A [Rickettsiales bacterium]